VPVRKRFYEGVRGRPSATLRDTYDVSISVASKHHILAVPAIPVRICPWVQIWLVCQRKSYSVSNPNTFVESNGFTGPHSLSGPLLCAGPANCRRSNTPHTPNHSMHALHGCARGHPKQVRNGLHTVQVAAVTKPVQHNCHLLLQWQLSGSWTSLKLIARVARQ